MVLPLPRQIHSGFCHWTVLQSKLKGNTKNRSQARNCIDAHITVDLVGETELGLQDYQVASCLL